MGYFLVYYDPTATGNKDFKNHTNLFLELADAIAFVASRPNPAQWQVQSILLSSMTFSVLESPQTVVYP